MSEVTPGKQSHLLNLLDFELPPPPTPRSAPAFSVREVESMKASFLSQISSIKAKLSGREAEVESLKKALEDAERRVGEAQEAGRDHKIKREHAEQEKADWEQRGREVENVLNSVKEEVLKSEAEKEALARRAEESDRRADELETRTFDLQAKLASMPIASVQCADGSSTPAAVTGDDVQRLVNAQLDQKIESVSRELHAVYKKKHETKVATLKKSYEARSEKRCTELQARLDELERQNEALEAAKEATFSNVLSPARGGASHVSQEEHLESRRAIDAYKVKVEEQKAQLVGLAEEIRAVRSEQMQLHMELEQERIEKGELVAAVDEMLALQSTAAAPAALEDFRKSIARPSGLKAPAGHSSGESRIGRGAVAGLGRVANNKSKMMNNIERMGGGRNFD